METTFFYYVVLGMIVVNITRGILLFVGGAVGFFRGADRDHTNERNPSLFRLVIGVANILLGVVLYRRLDQDTVTNTLTLLLLSTIALSEAFPRRSFSEHNELKPSAN